MREIIFCVNHLFSSEQFVVCASPAVADYLINEESHGLLPEIEMFISKQGSSQNRAVLRTKNSLMVVGCKDERAVKIDRAFYL